MKFPLTAVFSTSASPANVFREKAQSVKVDSTHGLEITEAHFLFVAASSFLFVL